MTAPQFFGALVRALGLYWLTHGLTYLPASMAPAKGYTPSLYFWVGVGEMLVGIFLMFKADGMVQTCYSLNALDPEKPPKNGSGTS